jgi:hypothetical protein
MLGMCRPELCEGPESNAASIAACRIGGDPEGMSIREETLSGRTEAEKSSPHLLASKSDERQSWSDGRGQRKRDKGKSRAHLQGSVCMYLGEGARCQIPLREITHAPAPPGVIAGDYNLRSLCRDEFRR